MQDKLSRKRKNNETNEVDENIESYDELGMEYDLPDIYLSNDDEIDFDGGLDEIMKSDDSGSWGAEIRSRAREIEEHGRHKEYFSIEMKEMGELLDSESMPHKRFSRCNAFGSKAKAVLTAAELLLTSESMSILIGACSAVADDSEGKRMLPYKKNAVIRNLEFFYRSFSNALDRIFLSEHGTNPASTLKDEVRSGSVRMGENSENDDKKREPNTLSFHIYRTNLDVLRSCWRR